MGSPGDDNIFRMRYTSSAEKYRKEADVFSTRYRSLLDSKLEEAGISPPRKALNLTGIKTRRWPSVKSDEKTQKHDPSHVVSAIARSRNEARNWKDQLAKMEKRALAAEERATEAVVMERKARAALEAREKQLANMRVRFDKMTSNAEKSESQRKILEEYVGKLERRLGSSEGNTKSASANRDIDQRALLDVVAELQEENGKLNDALQEVEEALEKEAKKLRLADGGVLLESLRTRRLLETAELALKRESHARKEIETKLNKCESRAQRAEGEKSDRIKAEEVLLARCEMAERDNQALLEYVEEITSSASPRKSPSPSLQLNDLKAFNEQLMKSAEESKGMAEKLRDEHITYIAEKENFALAIDGLNDDLIAIMSNSLGVCGQQKGYTDPKLDVAVLSAQRLVKHLRVKLKSFHDVNRRRIESERNKERIRQLQMRSPVRDRPITENIYQSERSPSVSPDVSTSSFSKVSPTNRPKFNARADVAERLERIAALKKRLGIYTSAKKPSGTQRAFVDDSDDDY